MKIKGSRTKPLGKTTLEVRMKVSISKEDNEGRPERKEENQK